MNHYSAAQLMQVSPVIPVMVIDRVDDAVPLALALRDGGIRILEVTLRTASALDAIARIVAEVDNVVVGAGTVTNAAQYEQALERGAQFVISPGVTTGLLQAAARYPVPYLPGVATISELMQAMDGGLTHLKFFPAAVAGGVAALKAFAGPFPDVRFCPTGGISVDNYLDYLRLPNVSCVGGSWVAPAATVQRGDWQAITALARQAVETAGQC